MTQASLYRGILRSKRESVECRRCTEINLEKARVATKVRTGRTPTDKIIWESLKNKEIGNKKIRNFLWKSIHDCLPCGHIWEKARNLEHRAHCEGCDKTESLKHILTECNFTGQKQIWKLVKETLTRKNIEFTNLSLGDIISCAVKGDYKKDKVKRKNV
jgi:hypothetical protein